MSDITITVPNGHLPHASSAFGVQASAALLPDFLNVRGSGVSSAAATCYERGPIAGGVVAGGVERGVERGKRPAMAPVAVEAAANAAAFAAEGADAQLFGQQKTQLLPMWALRGLQPWSDPT